MACALSRKGAPGLAWLDSALTSPASRWSVVAAWPDRALDSRRGDPDPLLALEGMVLEARPYHLLLALGYDLGARVDRFFFRAADDLKEPELQARHYPAILLHDAVEGAWWISGEDPRLRKALKGVSTSNPPPAPPAQKALRNFSREGYLAAIREAKRLIAEGEIYQANLAQRFQAPTAEAPLDIYRRLRRISPAPYAAFLDWGNRAVLSSSPELFLQVDGRKVLTRPIKGTRARGNNAEEDIRLLADLERSEKDRAELAMIVDLERNDLGRVCAIGSVRVEEARRLETFAGVHHAVATVSGVLEKGKGFVDLLRAAFPGGSVTGCPKLRAIEAIDAIEPTRRGIYCGALGWASAGSACLNLAIRTISVAGGMATLHAGGGIVADSEPDAEYQETLDKARGMLEALGAGAVV